MLGNNTCWLYFFPLLHQWVSYSSLACFRLFAPFFSSIYIVEQLQTAHRPAVASSLPFPSADLPGPRRVVVWERERRKTETTCHWNQQSGSSSFYLRLSTIQNIYVWAPLSYIPPSCLFLSASQRVALDTAKGHLPVWKKKPPLGEPFVVMKPPSSLLRRAVELFFATIRQVNASSSVDPL